MSDTCPGNRDMLKYLRRKVEYVSDIYNIKDKLQPKGFSKTFCDPFARKVKYPCNRCVHDQRKKKQQYKLPKCEIMFEVCPPENIKRKRKVDANSRDNSGIVFPHQD